MKEAKFTAVIYYYLSSAQFNLDYRKQYFQKNIFVKFVFDKMS